MICQQIFSILALLIFFLKILSKSASKSASIAWRLHCTSTTRCKIHSASRADEVSQPRSAGILVWVTSNMDSALVVSKPWQLFARNKTIPWQNSTALPWQMMVCTLRPCCWVLTEQVQDVVCRKQMQLGSAMSLRIVRTSCHTCFVKCHDGQSGFQREKLSSLSCQCGPKSCQKPRRPSVAQRKKQLSSLDCVNLLDRKQLRHVYTCRCDLMQCINAWH